MAAMSNYLEDALINAVLRNTSFTSPTTVYVGLYTSNPTDANIGTEVSGGSYSRQAVTFGAPSNGVSSNSVLIEFSQATANWGTVAYMGISDASTGGNLLFHGALTSSKTIESGDVFKFDVASLSVTLA